MEQDAAVITEQYATVDGLKTRYLDEGEGPVVLLLHGASLGSSVEVYEASIPALANAGLRAVAFDLPGYGLTDTPNNHGGAYRSEFIAKFMDALDIEKAHFVAHSGTGALAAQIALKYADRVEKIVAAAASSLLPPLPDQKGGGGGQAADPPPPTGESVRKQLEGDLFNKSLVTDDLVQKRLQMSAGKNFDASIERAKAAKASVGPSGDAPLWKRFAGASTPKLYLFGREDRGNAAERCAMLAAMEPAVKVDLIDQCNHLVMVDQPEEFNKCVVEFLAP